MSLKKYSFNKAERKSNFIAHCIVHANNWQTYFISTATAPAPTVFATKACPVTATTCIRFSFF